VFRQISKYYFKFANIVANKFIFWAPARRQAGYSKNRALRCNFFLKRHCKDEGRRNLLIHILNIINSSSMYQKGFPLQSLTQQQNKKATLK
jgi:hypothetical protein